MKQLHKVGVTGTRNGGTNIQLYRLSDLLKSLDASELHEGDCIGVDAQAVEIARSLGMRIISHPPLNPKYRAWAYYDVERPLANYLVRDQVIVDEIGLLIALPKGPHEELRSGTWATVRYARKVGRLIHIIFPDGRVKIEGS